MWQGTGPCSQVLARSWQFCPLVLCWQNLTLPLRDAEKPLEKGYLRLPWGRLNTARQHSASRSLMCGKNHHVKSQELGSVTLTGPFHPGAPHGTVWGWPLATTQRLRGGRSLPSVPGGCCCACAVRALRAVLPAKQRPRGRRPMA